MKDPTQRRFFKNNDLRDLFTLSDDKEEATETQSLFRLENLTGEEKTGDAGQEEATVEDGEEELDMRSNLLAQLVDNRGMHSVVNHDSIVGEHLPPDKAMLTLTLTL